MPGLQLIKILGNLLFYSKQLKLPVDFKMPMGNPKSIHYLKAFKLSDSIAIPSCIPPWFTPAAPANKYYQDSCDKVGNAFKELHDTMLDAIMYSHQMWKMKAKFKDLKVMSVSAIGTPGCLDGEDLESNIKNFPACSSWDGNKGKYRDAVAKGVAKCFKDWMGKVMVPGLPWYPAFAAFPGPMAPPMPNIPVPLIMCPSAMMSKIITPNDMKKEMIDAFDGDLKKKDKDKHHEAVFESIATVASLAFLMWMPMQMIMLVMGKGQIPSFAPPYVPVGPVVGGDNIGSPGHLMT